MVSPRRVTSAAALLTSPILFVVAAAVAVAAIRGLIVFAANADVFDLAASIEKGTLPDAGYLSRFVASNSLDRPASNCSDLPTRASLTVNLAALRAATNQNDVTAIDVAEGNAIRAAERRLKCDPLDGNAWLRYAEVEERGNGPVASVIDALRLSYWTTSSEAWILEPRLAFATPLMVAGVAGFETEYVDDLRRFSDYEATNRVASAYVGTAPQVRAQLHPLIEAQSEARKKAIVAEIDRLGVDFWRP